jgi:hypothetical protein
MAAQVRGSRQDRQAAIIPGPSQQVRLNNSILGVRQSVHDVEWSRLPPVGLSIGSQQRVNCGLVATPL